LAEKLAHARDHLAAVELDAAEHLLVWQGARTVFHVEARRAEGAHGRGDLAGDGLGRTDVQRADGDLALELGPIGRGPAALDPIRLRITW
jgi:hypothetical protein